MERKQDVFQPFANESDTFSIGELTIENRTDRITIFGNIDITRDMEGYQKATTLKKLFDDALQVLKNDKLPQKIATKPPTTVRNPFGQK